VAGLGGGVVMALGLVVVLLVRSHTSMVSAAKGSTAEAAEIDDGTTVIGGDPDASRPPHWVPSYPALQSESGGMKKEAKSTISGTYLARTKDTPEKVKEYFESTLDADGFETKATTSNTDGSESFTIDATKANAKRRITVMANRERGTTNLMIRYQGPK
jgi:hypothetical protein